MNKRLTALIVAAIVVWASTSVAAYVWYQKSRSSKPVTTTQTTPAPKGAPAATSQTTKYAVNVYFSRHSASDDDPAKVFAVKRTSPDSGVARYSMQQLLAGPSASETAAGYFTQARLRGGVSNCGGADFTIAIEAGVARLQFCKQFDHLGVVSDGQAESEIKATLAQFSNVRKITILNYQGNCEFDASGLNLCLL